MRLLWHFVAAICVALVALPTGGATAGDNDEDAPKACFDHSPESPAVNESVTFDSACSEAEEGAIAQRAWDLDNDGQFDDGQGVTVSRSWPAPGRYTVRLVVTDDRGVPAVRSRTVRVGSNIAPVASFSVSPASPVTGTLVTLTSTASDQDGRIESQEWDLNGDGRYGDARGTTASFTPTAAGTYSVGLRVVDNRDATHTFTQAIAVVDPAPPGQTFDTSNPPPPTGDVPPPLGWLEPFPIVRIRGRTTRSGARISLLTVTAPPGARARLRCAGRGCPLKSTSQTVGPTGIVRFKSIQRHLLAGVVLRVYTTHDGLIGKYSRFKIRRVKPPLRFDSCLLPGSLRPAACPPRA